VIQYAIADHQGNTRVVFSSATPVVQTPSTGFENDPGTLQNFPSGGNLSSLSLFNQTPSGTKSQLLNGGNNSQVGVAKSFAVYPGDKVKVQAYAKYEAGGSTPTSGFANALLQAFMLNTPGVGEAGTPSSALNAWGGLIDEGVQEGGTAPQAFVNVVVFDKDYNLLDAAWDQINEDAEQMGVSPDVAHDEMMKEYTIKEAGFVYLYVSNNSPVNVYFDDVTITHTPTNVVQYNEYYPFGLQASTSWTRENNKNDFKYNAGSELNNTSGWYEMFYRNYDPALGRMMQVDPYATMYASHSSYNYSMNNPVFFNDPNGGQAEAPPAGVSASAWNRINKDRNDPNYFQGWYDDFAAYSEGQAWQDPAEGYKTSDPREIAAILGDYLAGDNLDDIYYVAQEGYYSLDINAYWDGTNAVYEVGRKSNAGPGDGLNWGAGGRALVRLLVPFGDSIYPEEEEPGYDPKKVTIATEVPMPFGPGGGIKGGIAAYAKLQQITKGSKGLIQAHHIVEARHLERLGLSVSNAPSVILSREKHLEITNQLRQLLPFGKSYTTPEIMSAYQKVYSAHPEWLKAAASYLGF
jgi:RHS repeat-associated protein